MAQIDSPSYDAESESVPEGDATATIDIDAGGDVTVGENGVIWADAEVYTNRLDSYTLELDEEPAEDYVVIVQDATATVDITAGGAVTVEPPSPRRDGGIFAEATVYVENMVTDETTGDGSNPQHVYVVPGDATADITILAMDDVTVGSGDETYGKIKSEAWIEYLSVDTDTAAPPDQSYQPWPGHEVIAPPPPPPMPPEEVIENRSDASASVDIQTCGSVIANGQIAAEAYIGYNLDDGSPEDLPPLFARGNTSADVIVKAYEGVFVNQEPDEPVENGGFWSNGLIEAVAYQGYENEADVTILTVGDVIVNDGSVKDGYEYEDEDFEVFSLNSQEEIRAIAHSGNENDAQIGIATRAGDGGDVVVSGQIGAHTFEAIPIDIRDDSGAIIETDDASNTSTVEVCSAQDVIINGGHALYEVDGQGGWTLVSGEEEGGQILARAGEAITKIDKELGPTNTAEVEIYAGRDVIVHGVELEFTTAPTPSSGDTYFDGGQILALAGWSDYSTNTSEIGIYAGRDVTLNSETITGDPPTSFIVLPGSDSEVWATVMGFDEGTNTALIEICAQGNVTVDGAVVARAGNDSTSNSAHITVEAGGTISGDGEILADAQEIAAAYEDSVTFALTSPGMDNFNGDLSHDPPIYEDYDGCPECDFDWTDWSWCEGCEEPLALPALLALPAAPLPSEEFPVIEGCPVLMQAAALELGIGSETIQVAIERGLASTPNIQPCEACANIVNYARVLQDVDGTRMAAMLQIFNDIAPVDAPFTPEMGTSIAMAFSERINDDSMPQYATAMEYVDAFVGYVLALDEGLGSPVGDSVAFVMGKYGDAITASENPNIGAFIAARLEGAGG